MFGAAGQGSFQSFSFQLLHVRLHKAMTAPEEAFMRLCLLFGGVGV